MTAEAVMRHARMAAAEARAEAATAASAQSQRRQRRWHYFETADVLANVCESYSAAEALAGTYDADCYGCDCWQHVTEAAEAAAADVLALDSLRAEAEAQRHYGAAEALYALAQGWQS
jgi:hypothetical protein